MKMSHKIFLPNRSLGYVSNEIPLQVRYIKNRKTTLIVTCVGKAFHTYGISHFGLLSVSGLHPDDITAMTADTYHVYTACKNTIYAWRRGTELKHTYRGHKKSVHLMIPFGPHLISVDEDSTVRVWNIIEETTVLELNFPNDTFQITAMIHPSTYINKILLGSDQGTLQLWNINRAKQIYTFKGWNDPVTCLVQAPAIDVIGVGLISGKILLHNIKYDEVIMEFTQDWGAVTSISFRSDGNPIMASGSQNGHIVFWDLEERRVTSQLMSAHDGPITGMVCLPSEPLIVTSSPDNTLKLWIFDMSDGGARLLRIREGHSATPSVIRFHGGNGDNILSAAGDSTLRIFNTKNEQFNKSLGKASYNRKISKKRGRMVEDPLIMPPIEHFTSETTREKEWDNIAAIHSGLPLVTTWSYDKLKMGELKLLPERFHKHNISPKMKVVATCLCITYCGNFVIVGYSTGHVDKFNIQSGLWRDSYYDLDSSSVPIRGVVTDILNQITISGNSNGRINFYKFKNKGAKPLTALEIGESINFLRIHHQSSMLAAVLEDFNIFIIDIDTRTAVRKFIGHTSQITDADFSPDSRWLISASMDCSIRTWDIPSAHLINQFKFDSPCTSLSMSPTGELLATAHVNYLGIFLWSNRSLYTKVTFKAISPTDEVPYISLSECMRTEHTESNVDQEEMDKTEFISPEQITEDLITLSGLSSSRWQNLLNIDVIRAKNKPKQPPKAPKAAPFFLPTIPSLDFQFDLRDSESVSTNSKLLGAKTLVNLSPFGKLLNKTAETNDFVDVIDKLKSLGPSMIDMELKMLAPEEGGTLTVMLQFLKCIIYMLKSNRDFELAEAYLSVFLREHGKIVAHEEALSSYLTYIQVLHENSWNKMKNNLFYNLSIVQSLKML